MKLQNTTKLLKLFKNKNGEYKNKKLFKISVKSVIVSQWY